MKDESDQSDKPANSERAAQQLRDAPSSGDFVGVVTPPDVWRRLMETAFAIHRSIFDQFQHHDAQTILAALLVITEQTDNVKPEVIDYSMNCKREVIRKAIKIVRKPA